VRQRRREEAEPAVEVREINLQSGGVYADRLWAEIRSKREALGEIIPGSPSERDLLQLIDSARVDAIARDNETAADRRRRHREYWADRMRVGRGRRYEPHPARAGD